MNRIIIGIALFSFAARAYEPPVHTELCKEAANQSNLPTTLRDRFGEAFGLDTVVNGRSIRNWIGQGGTEEDSPSRRCLNHFHQPLAAWSDAGLFTFPIVSSVYWQQANNRQTIIGGGDWSWPTLRAKYRTYLTSTSSTERNNALADIARGLGQLAHLVQDATSPPHTRADPHRLFDGYESFTDALRTADPELFAAILHSPPVRPDPNIFAPTDDTSAPSPIARLIDDNIYAGDAFSYNTSGLMGTAEYTNGGFLSDDTVFKDFALPRESVLVGPFEDQAPVSFATRKYYKKVGDGDTIQHFVAEGTLLEKLNQFSYGFASYILDDATYTDAASKLMPRAVGYSAALFDYFFREQLEVTAPDRYVYGAAQYDTADPQLGTFKKIKARVRRKPGTPESLGPGTLTAVMRYRYLDGSFGVPLTDSFKEPDAPIRVAWEQSVSKPVPVFAVGDSVNEFTFDFSDSQIPVNGVDMRLFVVFQGTVGAESDAVAVGIRDMAEPDPVDYVNGSDWECYSGILYNIGDATLYPTLQSRDVDADGRVDLFGPYTEHNMHFKASGLDRIFLPSGTTFDMQVSTMTAAGGSQAARVVILQDRSQYAALVAYDNDRIDSPFGPVIRPPGGFAWGAVLNSIIDFPPYGLVHYVTLNETYRGKVGFHEIVLVSQPTLPCFGQTPTLKPDITLIAVPPLEINP